MAPEPDDERMWPGGGSEPPRVAACRRDGPPPHTHIWTTARRPGGTQEIEVCIRCHQLNWEQLDAQIRVFAEKLTQKVTERIIGVLTEDAPPPEPPAPGQPVVVVRLPEIDDT